MNKSINNSNIFIKTITSVTSRIHKLAINITIIVESCKRKKSATTYTDMWPFKGSKLAYVVVAKLRLENQVSVPKETFWKRVPM